MAVRKGSSGKVYQISNTPFAGGGEGSVYDISGDPNHVAKIYREDRRTTERERKLLAMMKKQPGMIEQYAWPVDVLYENGKFVGFVMPRFRGKEKLSSIYVYDKRGGKPWSLYVAIAKNLAAAISNVHEINQVIGDLNPENIMADPVSGLVVLVDTDSFHISDASRTYRCGVGRPEFIPRELQNTNFSSSPLPTFTKESDRFALAVLIFSLLMNGNHPFACRVSSGSASAFQPVENIKNCQCAFFAESRKGNTQIPPTAPELSSLPSEIQNLFRRAFIQGHTNPSARPTAEEWYYALERLEGKLKKCSRNAGHLYYQGSGSCPWCDVDSRLQMVKKSVTSSQNSGGARSTTTNTSRPTQTGTTRTGTAQSGTTGSPGGVTSYTPRPNPIIRFLRWLLVDIIITPIISLCELVATVVVAIVYWVLELGGFFIGAAVVIGLIVLLVKGGGAIKSGISHLFHRSPSEQATVEEVLEETVVVTEDGEAYPAVSFGGREREDNGTKELANPIVPNTQYVGSLSGKQNVEKDWYVLTLDEPGLIRVTVNTKKQFSLTGTRVYWTVQLSRAGAYTLLFNELIAGDETLTESQEMLVGAGTYYFLVQSGKKKYTEDDYRFTIHYTPIGTLDHEIEPNDSVETATVIKVNTAVTGDLTDSHNYGSADHYQFTVPADGVFRIHLNTPLQAWDYQSYWDMNVVSEKDTGKELWGGTWIYGDAEETVLSYIGASAGDVYCFWVEPGFCIGEGEYTVYVEFEERDDWEVEDNGSVDSATPIEPDREYHGALSAKYSDEQDWYSFTVDEESEVMLSFRTDAQQEYDVWDVSVRRQDGEGTEDLWREHVPGSVQSEPLVLAPGTYYVEVESTSHWTPDPYSIIVNRIN